MIKEKGEEFLFGQTEIDTKVNLEKIKEMEWEKYCIRMVISMMVIGLKIRKMVWDAT